MVLPYTGQRSWLSQRSVLGRGFDCVEHSSAVTRQPWHICCHSQPTCG